MQHSNKSETEWEPIMTVDDPLRNNSTLTLGSNRTLVIDTHPNDASQMTASPIEVTVLELVDAGNGNDATLIPAPPVEVTIPELVDAGNGSYVCKKCTSVL